MEIYINPRGNGACPICRNVPRCRIRKVLRETMEVLKPDDELEVVVYTCPKFKEKST